MATGLTTQPGTPLEWPTSPTDLLSPQEDDRYRNKPFFGSSLLFLTISPHENLLFSLADRTPPNCQMGTAQSMECSPSCFSVHGILQARTLEWVVIFYSRRSSWPGDWTASPALQMDSLTLCHQERPHESLNKAHEIFKCTQVRFCHWTPPSLSRELYFSEEADQGAVR